jgi:hypothetical protein
MANTNNVNMFQAGDELYHQRRHEESGEIRSNNIVKFAQLYGIDEEEMEMIYDFKEDVLSIMFAMVDNITPYRVFHLDGTPISFALQFDMQWSIAPPHGFVLVQDFEDGSRTIVRNIEYFACDVKYVKADSLRKARRAIVESPDCTDREKVYAIRQVFDNFVAGVNEDELIPFKIDSNTADKLWEMTEFCRPANQGAMLECIHAHGMGHML